MCKTPSLCTPAPGDNIKDYDVFGEDLVLLKMRTEAFIGRPSDEPHVARRKAIIKAHPEIKKLFGHEPLTKWIMIGLITFQLASAYMLRDMAYTWQYFLWIYVFGATAAQAIFLGIHEISHGLAFKERWKNIAFMTAFCNNTTILPFAGYFRDYHMDHHLMQGRRGIDSDIPSDIEIKLLSSRPGKLLFCTFFVIFYVLRPLTMKPAPFTKWNVLNYVAVFATDYFVITQWGMGAFVYLVLSILTAGSLHPCASHFIAEHFTYIESDPKKTDLRPETFSYYGPLNYLCFNVGYHNEHHDFPAIPWSRLPKVHSIANEFYANLPYHKSWVWALVHFIIDDNVTLHNRVVEAK